MKNETVYTLYQDTIFVESGTKYHLLVSRAEILAKNEPNQKLHISYTDGEAIKMVYTYDPIH